MKENSYRQGHREYEYILVFHQVGIKISYIVQSRTELTLKMQTRELHQSSITVLHDFVDTGQKPEIMLPEL